MGRDLVRRESIDRMVSHEHTTSHRNESDDTGKNREIATPIDKSAFIDLLPRVMRSCAKAYVDTSSWDSLERMISVSTVSAAAKKIYYSWKTQEATVHAGDNRSNLLRSNDNLGKDTPISRLKRKPVPCNPESDPEIVLKELDGNQRPRAERLLHDGEFEKLNVYLRAIPKAHVGYKRWNNKKRDESSCSASAVKSGVKRKLSCTEAVMVKMESCASDNNFLSSIKVETGTNIQGDRTAETYRVQQTHTYGAKATTLLALQKNYSSSSSSNGEDSVAEEELTELDFWENNDDSSSMEKHVSQCVQTSKKTSGAIGRPNHEESLGQVKDKEVPHYSKNVRSNCTNILVMGETGVGKSTFINGLVNYLKYNSMEEALKGGFEVLIDSAFTLTDDNFKSHQISCNSTITAELNSDSNENTVAGQSATQDPKSYVFSCGSAGEEKKIRLIDTPGIGDTRGPDQDKINFDKILSFISKYGSLHAICILIRPNTARLTLAFRFCVDELLVHLHKSASKNILFCFTNTRGTLYKPGDTLPTLREHLNNLKAKTNVEIPINRSTVFCFDNESFRFLCALKHGFPFTETDVANFAASWKQSVQETEKLLTCISQLPVHSVRDTLSLNSTRNLIISLARPLGDLVMTQFTNMQVMEERMDEIFRRRAAGISLENHLYVHRNVLVPVRLPQPQTVCTSYNCVERRLVNPESRATITIYKTVCHQNCRLDGVQTETIPNSKLQKCCAMRFGGVCGHCACSWEKHMHINYLLDSQVTTIVDPNVEASLRRGQNDDAALSLFMANKQRMQEEVREEIQFMIDCCAEFAVFMEESSIVKYFDTFGQYIDHLIAEEHIRISMGECKRKIIWLQRLKYEYSSKIHSLKVSISNRRQNVKNIDEIEALINQLGQLSSCGPVVTAIREMNGNVADQDTDQGHVVEVGGSLLGSAVSKILSAIGLQ